jgi:hypothetical protein
MQGKKRGGIPKVEGGAPCPQIFKKRIEFFSGQALETCHHSMLNRSWDAHI